MKMQRIITLLLISLMIMFMATGTVLADPNLVGHWKFDEATGTTASDSSGNGNHGVLINNPIWTTGTLDQALEFDGDEDYVHIDSNPGITDYPLTIAAWIKTSTTDTDIIVSFGDSGTSNDDLVNLSVSGAGYAIIYTRNGSIDMADSNPVIVADGMWHHIVGTLTSNTERDIYVDGIWRDENTTSLAFPSNVDRIHIGVQADSTPSNYFSGTIDDVRIYNRVLSDSEIQDLYQGTGGTNNPPDGDILDPPADENIAVGDSINFNGSGTDPDGDSMTYQWNFGAGSGIPDNNTESPGSIVFNNPGQFVVTFTVTDSHGLPDPTPDTVTINVSEGGIGDGHSLDAADGDPTDAVFVDNEGNVGISTTNPGIYKLAVNGTIKSKEVIVDTTGWSDFVFEEHYTLMPLGQLEKYIKSNKHLPQIPSAEDVAVKGIKIGSMQSRLLQKIEELTLYMIKLEKKTEEFEKENEMLKKRLKALEKGRM